MAAQLPAGSLLPNSHAYGGTHMYQTILVPLDGSPFGERAISLALRVARAAGATLELTHVREPFAASRAAATSARRGAGGAAASLTMLAGLCARTEVAGGLTVTATLLEGEIASALQAHVEASASDLVVMTAHGHGGAGRAWLGSVAEALVHRLRVPVLLAWPRVVGHGRADAPPFRRILVPLDGSPLAEEVLDHAVAAGTWGHTEYLLLQVVTSGATGSEPHVAVVARTDDADLERRRLDAMCYLAAVAERVRRPGVAVNVDVVVHARPARAILSVARTRDVELIALTTQGEGALAQPLAASVAGDIAGSVADEVIRGAGVPTLLYRPATVPSGAAEGTVAGQTGARQ